MQNKLMKIYDKSYDDLIGKILLRENDREKARELIGKIYKEALDILMNGDYRAGSVEGIFERVKLRYGIS